MCVQQEKQRFRVFSRLFCQNTTNLHSVVSFFFKSEGPGPTSHAFFVHLPASDAFFVGTSVFSGFEKDYFMVVMNID